MVSLHGGTATWGARSRSENGLLSVSERPAEPVGIGVVGARLRLFPTSPVPSGTVRETWVCPWRRRHRSRSPGGCASGAGRREAGSGSPSSRSSPLYLWSSCAPSLPPSATARRRPAGTAPVRVISGEESYYCGSVFVSSNHAWCCAGAVERFWPQIVNAAKPRGARMQSFEGGGLLDAHLALLSLSRGMTARHAPPSEAETPPGRQRGDFSPTERKQQRSWSF